MHDLQFEKRRIGLADRSHDVNHYPIGYNGHHVLEEYGFRLLQNVAAQSYMAGVGHLIGLPAYRMDL